MKKAFLYLAMVALLIMSGCGSESKLNDEDIALKPAHWTTEESFLGMGYGKEHHGVLVTNNCDKAVVVTVKADFHDKDGNWIESKEYSTSPIGTFRRSCFVEIPLVDDKADMIEYTLVEQKASRYTIASVGFTDGCDVMLDTTSKEDTVIAANTSGHGMEASGCQFLYFDAAGEIIHYEYISMGEIPAGKKVSQAFDQSFPDNCADYDMIPYAYYTE